LREAAIPKSPISKDEIYDEKEAKERFEAALRAGLKTPPKPLKDKPKVKKAKSKKKSKK
jgi:hypothetical protein